MTCAQQVGAPGDDSVELDGGCVYLLLCDRLTGSVLRSFKLTALAGFPGPTAFVGGKRDATGSAVACLGDLDGDGDLELIVGAEGYSK